MPAGSVCTSTALAVVGIKACSDQLAAGRAQAEPAAEQFTRLYDDAEYETIYASSDPALKKAMSAEELAQRLDSVKARLGNVVAKSFGASELVEEASRFRSNTEPHSKTGRPGKPSCGR